MKLANSLATHATIQDAYNVASDNESFLMQIYTFQENLFLSREINLKHKGEKDSGYNTTIGVTTIQQGSVEISDVVIWWHYRHTVSEKGGSDFVKVSLFSIHCFNK